MEPLSIASNVPRDNSNKGVSERPTDNPMPVGPAAEQSRLDCACATPVVTTPSRMRTNTDTPVFPLSRSTTFSSRARVSPKGPRRVVKEL